MNGLTGRQIKNKLEHLTGHNRLNASAVVGGSVILDFESRDALQNGDDNWWNSNSITLTERDINNSILDDKKVGYIISFSSSSGPGFQVGSTVTFAENSSTATITYVTEGAFWVDDPVGTPVTGSISSTDSTSATCDNVNARELIFILPPIADCIGKGAFRFRSFKDDPYFIGIYANGTDSENGVRISANASATQYSAYSVTRGSYLELTATAFAGNFVWAATIQQGEWPDAD